MHLTRQDIHRALTKIDNDGENAPSMPEGYHVLRAGIRALAAALESFDICRCERCGGYLPPSTDE